MERTLVQYHRHLLLDCPLLLPVVHSKDPDLPGVPPDQIQDALDGGGLSRAVLPDEAQDGPSRHR